MCRYGVEEEGGYVSICRYVGMARRNKGICVDMLICVDSIFLQTFARVYMFSNVCSCEHIFKPKFAIIFCNTKLQSYFFPYFAIIFAIQNLQSYFAIQNLQSYFSIFCNHICNPKLQSKLKLQFKLTLQFNMMNIHIFHISYFQHEFFHISNIMIFFLFPT
jgi:hypothetical protein